MKKVLSLKLGPMFDKMIYRGRKSTVIQLTNGDVLKIFDPSLLNFLNREGIDIESKILDSGVTGNIPEIVTPKIATYGLFGDFEGYTMPFVNGTSLADYVINSLNTNNVDLEEVASIYQKIENAVKRDDSIIFPDLCTLANTYITGDGNIQFIDYDGMQIGKHRSASLSSGLGSREFIENNIIWNPKYTEEDGKYKKNIDKRSLAYIYFLMAFGVNLSTVGKYSDDLKRCITIEDALFSVGLIDIPMAQKFLNMFYSEKDDEYLGDDVLRVADRYKVQFVPTGNEEKKYTRMLVRK